MYQKTTIVGRIGNDIKVSKTSNGKSVCNLRVATEVKKGETVWFSVTLWESSADFAAKYARKGSLVLCEGGFRTETYKEVERLVLHAGPYGFRILADGVRSDDTGGI